MEYRGFHVSMRRLLAFALVALVIGSSLGGALWSLVGVHFFKNQPLKKFSSYQELVAFVKKGPQDIPQSLFQRFQSMLQSLKTGKFRGVLSPSWGVEQAGAGFPEYSPTNIQVEGVDEADVVKTDGRYIYLVSGSVVYILYAYPPEDAQVLSKLDLSGTVVGIFVNGEKLVVFRSGSAHPEEVFFMTWTMTTSILTYDLSDRSKPVLERNVTVDGSYFSSRMIGDYVYAVIIEQAYLINDSAVALPEIHSGDSRVKVEASNIYHTDLPDAYDFFTNMIAINVQDAGEEPTVETFLLGVTSCLYVSRENIFLTSPAYHGNNIHKISIEKGEITYVANGFVPGYVLNQFSMDEYNGYFRIATTTSDMWSGASRNNVYILDMNLTVVGKLEDLASGERIHSARFMGDRCYLVTFRKVDPLFVIDLENPSNPEVLGFLKITGYSDYLHPYDENHIIGIGKETVAAEEGDFAWYQGVKISLFDVSNVSNPQEIGKYEIGDRGTDSPVLRDHKAFLFDRSRNLLVIPVLVAEIDETQYPEEVPPYAYGEPVWQGAYVFNISLDEGLVLKGRITHIENDADLMNSDFYFSSPYYVKRTLYIDNLLYTISDKKIKMNNLENLEEIGVMDLL